SDPASQQQPDLMSLAVLRHSANRFVRLAEVDSGRLAQHRANLAELRRVQADDSAASSCGQLNRELVNASRCVGQLKLRLQELRQLQEHVRPSDRSAFDAIVRPTVAMVTEQIRDFTQAYIDATVCLDAVLTGEAATAAKATAEPPASSDSPASKPRSTAQMASYVFDDSPALPDSTPALALEAATESLARDLADLEQLMSQLSATVASQADGVASVESSIVQAEANAEDGVRWLRRAVGYRAYYLPVAGAATGALLGGPVGLLIGLKAGAAAGLLGGVAGYASGRIIGGGDGGGGAEGSVRGEKIELQTVAKADDAAMTPDAVDAVVDAAEQSKTD
ncbi:hypothetical protein BOX15_Mlig008443g5, partial [Macrostomum lignano]